MLIEVNDSRTLQCAICGEQHPAMNKYFIHADKGQIHDRCLACYDEFLGKERRVFDRYKARPGYKWCKKCNTEYPANSIYWVTRAKKYGGQCLSPCRRCMRSVAAAWRDKNKEHLREQMKANKAHRSEVETQSRKYLQTLPTDFTNEDWLFCLSYFGSCCATCRAPSTDDVPLHRDHWIAISSSDCPGTVPTNIVPLCETCNSRKSTRPAEEWLEFEFGEEMARQRLAEIDAFFALVRTERHQAPERKRGRQPKHKVAS